MTRQLGEPTHTYTTLFDADEVDKIVDIYEKLKADFEGRREYMTEVNQQACESRLALLRETGTLLKDRAAD